MFSSNEKVETAEFWYWPNSPWNKRQLPICTNQWKTNSIKYSASSIAYIAQLCGKDIAVVDFQPGKYYLCIYSNN